ncbi:MAG: septum formation initiator family protein [Firmicutes bacterium]|nr:septum formation initiator family protein [Bacillota bacterium]
MRANRRDDKVAPFPRRKQSSFGFFKLAAVAGLLLLSLFFTLIAVQMYQYNRLHKKLAAAELQVQEKELRNEELAEEIEKLGDPGYIGMLARKLLGLVRPGEIVFQLED